MRQCRARVKSNLRRALTLRLALRLPFRFSWHLLTTCASIFAIFSSGSQCCCCCFPETSKVQAYVWDLQAFCDAGIIPFCLLVIHKKRFVCDIATSFLVTIVFLVFRRTRHHARRWVTVSDDSTLRRGCDFFYAGSLSSGCSVDEGSSLRHSHAFPLVDKSARPTAPWRSHLPPDSREVSG